MKLYIIIFIICTLDMATSMRFLPGCFKSRTKSKPAGVPVPQTSTDPSQTPTTPSQTPTTSPQTQQGSDSNSQDPKSTKVDIFDFIQLVNTINYIDNIDVERYFKEPCSGALDQKLEKTLAKIKETFEVKKGREWSVTREELHKEFNDNHEMLQVVDLKKYLLVGYERFNKDDLMRKFCIPKKVIETELLPRRQSINIYVLRYWFEKKKLPERESQWVEEEEEDKA